MFPAMNTTLHTWLQSIPAGLAIALLLACSVNLAALCRLF
jgi:hypothetical protein